MKKVKWLCLGMLLVLCLGAFFACGDNNGGSATIDHELVKGTHWEGVNQFEGEKLKISLSVEQYNNKSTIPSSDRYIRGSNEATSDNVQNLVYNRNKNVRDMLGIDVEYQEVKHQYAEVSGYIDELVMAATDETTFSAAFALRCTATCETFSRLTSPRVRTTS